MLSGLIKRIRKSLKMRKYDRFTIAEYFREQGAQIGEGCSIIPRFLGAEPYLVRIGNHVTVAAGVVFITHDGGCWVFREEIPDLQVFGPIIIEDNCVIGQNAVLFPNIRIGTNSIVGAGSVVISDVPPNTVVMGVPARPFGSISKYKEKCLEKWTAQKPPDVVLAPGETWWNSPRIGQHRKKLKEHLMNIFKDELGGNK